MKWLTAVQNFRKEAFDVFDAALLVAFIAVMFLMFLQIMMPFGPVITVFLVLVFTIFAIGEGEAVMSVGGIMIYVTSWPITSAWGPWYGTTVWALGVLLWFWALFRSFKAPRRDPLITH